MEEGAAEVGELGAEGGERGVEISPVLGDVAMAPAMVVVSLSRQWPRQARRQRQMMSKPMSSHSRPS